ncbi:major facilitator superfamily domain-containing protein [Glomus cerebriforme]|uniref:Lysosomal dipeptide transporter MFSD1 n=1 Tax=Glomus cerebriforme TaxID=658196 RepID=A0A397SAS6_9GLOM|nr:major facilitator superfamily domain-containing protein [Glomus cerebriforme]
MEQINLTTISTKLSEEEDTDEESDSPSFTPTTLPTSFSTPTVSENSEILDDKEWLIKNKRISTGGSSRRSHHNGEHAGDHLRGQTSGSRRKSLKVDNADHIIKMCAMACACTFGVGSHFASHIIGPMKGILMEQLDLTNTQFSLLVASLTLCNTVIPIVSGLLVARFGTTRSSLVITTIILLGMIIFTAASWNGKVGLMIAGFIVFGMGLAPLTIVQETIIVQFFQGNGLGFALAVGLTLGRLASFVATVLAVPLSLMEPLTYRTPFIVATATCAVSWIMNIVYVYILKHADNRKNHNKEGVALHSVVEKKAVHWNAIFDLSDIFWWFLVVGILFGASMSPFLHLSSNIIKHRFDTTDMLAAWDSSVILLLPVILYPFLGLFLDKFGFRFISITYLLLLSPPNLIHPFPPIFLFAVAYAAVPLTMVTLIPLLTKNVSTGLGLLKSVDNIGATLSQTFAGILLDEHVRHKKYIIDDEGIEYGHEDDDLVALRMFAILSSFLFLVSLVFWWMDKTYKGGSLNAKYEGEYHNDNTNNYGQLRSSDDDDEVHSAGLMRMIVIEEEISFVRDESIKKRKRTIIYMGILGLMMIICWIVFGVVAFEKAGISASDEKVSE